jgi:hypothetical protein
MGGTMQTRKHIEQLWHHESSGVITPAGVHSDLSFVSTETFLRIKEKAAEIEALYESSSVALPKTCHLSQLIEDARILSDAWLLNRKHELTATRQFRVMHLNRIADAVLPLHDIPERTKYLVSLTSGNLDLLSRHRCHAKDVLWELELWSALRSRSFDVSLLEPDILARFEGLKLAIACKKLHSDRHLQNVLSRGVAQVKSSSDFGIVAINIDDLIDANVILRIGSVAMAERFVTAINDRFLFVHDRHFRKYLSSGRLLCVLVSTAVIADIPSARPRFHNVRRSSIWTIPGLPVEKERMLRRFYSQLMQ